LFDLGIDRREPVETGWHFGYQAIPAVGSAAFVNLRSEGEGTAAQQKRMTFIVSCGSTASFTLTSLQRLPNSTGRSTTDLRVGAGSFSATLTSTTSFLSSYKNEIYEVRQLAVARARFDALVGAPVITITELPTTPRGERNESSASTLRFDVPATGDRDALKILVAHCAPVQASPSAGSVSAAVAKVSSVATASLSAGAPREGPGWRFAFLPVGAIGSAAFANSPWTRPPTVLAISCAAGRSTFTISTVTRLADASAPLKSDIVIGDAALGISLPPTNSTVKTRKGDPYEVRQSKWPGSVIEKLLASSAIRIREAADGVDAPAHETPPGQYWMTTKGAQDAFKALGNQCALLN
jgi:hypothetical protein